MVHVDPDKLTHLADTPGFRKQLSRRLHLPDVVREPGLLPLLLSTTLAEVAGNIVYVVLLERAYQLGSETASVGGVLVAQSVPQVLLLDDQTGQYTQSSHSGRNGDLRRKDVL